MTGRLDNIEGHPRLLRSLSFGDDDYESCVALILDSIFGDNPELIEDVIDHFDIDLWYEQKSPTKYQRVFSSISTKVADFWTPSYIRLFVSHLSSTKRKVSTLKSHLSQWGISAFIAHEDIQPTREWRDEVEAGLETMDLLAAVVEHGFKESDWCTQEVGYAMGRKVDIIPLRAGLDPFGFFGKYQGIQVKGMQPKDVADEIASLLLKKPNHRNRMLQILPKSFSALNSDTKVEQLKLLDSWCIVTDSQMKDLLEQSSLSDSEKTAIQSMIDRVHAFSVSTQFEISLDDEVPF